MHARRFTRRTVAASAGSTLALGALGQGLARQATPGATPSASPIGGEWTWTDVLGTTVTLPRPPQRIAANLVTAAALWDLGVEVVAVFDYTATAFPDGDHIAWGNVDPSKVVNVGDVDGNILPEDLLKVQPDVILTLTFEPSDPSQTAGVIPDLADAIGKIAPVLVVTDMGSTEIQLQRLIDLGASLGADLNAPAVIEARDAYEAKVEEFKGVAAEKADLTVIFANVDADAFYVGGPQGVAELLYLSSLGLPFANADSSEAGEFWETLSLEQALKYPADVFYNDVYSAFKSLEELQGAPGVSSIAAIEAGQLGEWPRDFPVSYEGVTAFLETILTPLREAQRVRPE